MTHDVPIITAEQLQERKWFCDGCGCKVIGPECPSCGAPPPEAVIVIPDGVDEEVMERIKTKKRCGDCRHFDLRMGQEILHHPRDPMFHRMVREMELKSLATNMEWSQQGLCTLWTGGRGQEHFTNAKSPGRINKGRLDSSTPYKEKDHNVDCPAFKPKSSDGKDIRSYRQVPDGRTRGTD